MNSNYHKYIENASKNLQQSIHANIVKPFQSNLHGLSNSSQEEMQVATTEKYPIAHVNQPYAEDEEYSNDEQPYTEEYPDDPFAHEGQPYPDQPYVAEDSNGSLIDEEQPYSQYDNQPYSQYDDQPYTEECPDDPFAQEGQPYPDQPYVSEDSIDSLIDEEQPYSHEKQQSDQHPFSEERINDNTPLYPGASITVNVTMILLLAFAVRRKLTNEAISDLLYLIDTICPKPNNTCKTLYNFKIFFSYSVIPTDFCYYCPDCFSPISSVTTMLCSICKKPFKSIKDFSYFLHFSVRSQIRAFFARHYFLSLIQHRFKRGKIHENNYEDIYDGSIYQQHSAENGILACCSNISLTWNIDGLPLFKSSKFNLWPMYFVINELPYELRIRTENMIISGLWFGESKPNMNVFLQPIFTELTDLESNGVEVKSPSVTAPFISKAIVLAGTCDLPAKSLIYSIQFNIMRNMAAVSV